MPEGKKPKRTGAGLENLSVNSARRSGTREDGVGNAGRRTGRKESTESARVPDEQSPKR